MEINMKGLTKTFLLLAALTALFMFAGYALGGAGGAKIAFFIALAMNFFSYWNSDKIVLRLYKAQPLNPATHGNILNMVEELARNAGIPTPKAYIIENPQPNAFATGRNPANGAVAVTSGIVNLLSERELRGVIAHELAHIKNRDTLIMTITSTIAGALSYLANFAMFFGGSRERGGNPIAIIVVSILAPLAAMLVQFAISRTREYSADRAGAEISGDPEALASALQKLQNSAKRIDNNVAENNPATAHMFIVNPLHARKVDGLFTTHPATENRVNALMQIASEMGVSGKNNLEQSTPVSYKKGTFDL
jgi:heat shock protein HtpX